MVKKFLLTILGAKLGHQLIEAIQLKKFAQGDSSFSQEGEDRVLANLFRGKNQGFYVDVGSHHPYCLSNTNLFYQKGWRGINIDANPELINAFQKCRPLDINLTAGVGNHTNEMVFYQFEEPALSSFDEKLSMERKKAGRKILSTIKVKIQPLREILDQHLPAQTTIDFMNVDVEGFDLDVLKSNNWQKYRPQFLLVECVGLDLLKISENETYQFLKQQNYELTAKLLNTCIFKSVN